MKIFTGGGLIGWLAKAREEKNNIFKSRGKIQNVKSS